MAGNWLIYGATGYTGSLIAAHAAESGLAALLGGRDTARVRSLAARLGCDWRVATLTDPRSLEELLAGVEVVLNAASPFTRSARALADACLRSGTHYLDVSGEIPVLAALAGRDADARRAGVMLMPAVGFMVVPSDCLLAHLVERLPSARRLWLGISRSRLVSRGSARTLAALAADGVQVRRDGVLRRVRAGTRERVFDFGAGYRRCAAVSWADLFSAWHTTGIADIETYLEVSPLERAAFEWGRWYGPLLASAPGQAALQAQVALLPEGPSARERARARRVLVADVADDEGGRACARLTTPDSYDCTASAAVAVVRRVLAGHHRPGYRTPAGVYGPALLDDIVGARLEDLV